MKLLAFAASNSKHSINKKLVVYATGLMKGVEVELLDIHDYEMPIFSIDRENEYGIPELAHQFLNKIGTADALLISFAEHNSSYTAAYKNLFDWASRIDARVYQDKPMVMLSTSPGARGGASVLEAALASAGRFGGDVKASLSVPSFHSNFDMEKGKLTNPEIKTQLKAVLDSLKAVGES
jgi:NAD(P)H-dependent FMN reductase